MDGEGRSEIPRDLPIELRLVGNRYRVEGLIGRGSMGSVYRARHVLTDNLVALKCILPDASQRELVMARFRREVSVSAHVEHEGIVRVHDAGEEEDGTLYLAMDLLSGETLYERSRKVGFTAAYGLNVARAMLEPLSAVHAAGIIHRDIKPENIFLHRRADGRDQVKLLDFGIARDPRHASTTRTDVGLGTPFYMSPEQATNARAVSPASDVWSVGIVLYWLVAGRLPFVSDTPFNTLTKVCTEPHPPPAVQGGHTTQQLIDLIDRALSKEPSGRPADARALLAELNDILGPIGSSESLSAITYGSNPQLGAPWPPPAPAALSSPGVLPALPAPAEAPGPPGAPVAPPRRPLRPVALGVAGLLLAATIAVGVSGGLQGESGAIEGASWAAPSDEAPAAAPGPHDGTAVVEPDATADAARPRSDDDVPAWGRGRTARRSDEPPGPTARGEDHSATRSGHPTARPEERSATEPSPPPGRSATQPGHPTVAARRRPDAPPHRTPQTKAAAPSTHLASPRPRPSDRRRAEAEEAASIANNGPAPAAAPATSRADQPRASRRTAPRAGAPKAPAPRATAGDERRESPRDEPDESPRDAPDESPRDAPDDSPRDAPDDSPRDAPDGRGGRPEEVPPARPDGPAEDPPTSPDTPKKKKEQRFLTF